MFSTIHAPRTTGDVRFGADVAVRMLPWPSSPRRGLSGGSCDAAQVGVANAVDAVVRRESLVQIRVVGVEQLEHAAALAQDLGEQELGLVPKRRAQVRVEVGVLRRNLVELAQLQPLAGEVLDEPLRAFVGEQSLDLRREHGGLVQSPAAATASSSSSGMLLQRKNDSREASSRSLIA